MRTPSLGNKARGQMRQPRQTRILTYANKDFDLGKQAFGGGEGKNTPDPEVHAQ